MGGEPPGVVVRVVVGVISPGVLVGVVVGIGPKVGESAPPACEEAPAIIPPLGEGLSVDAGGLEATD